MKTMLLGAVVGTVLGSLPCVADTVTLTGDGSWSAGPWSPQAPAAGDTVEVAGRKLEVDANVNGVTVNVGSSSAVTTKAGSTVYFGNGTKAEGSIDWNQVGGSFVSLASVFELSYSGSGPMKMTFEDADVAFSNKVVLGRSSGRAFYEQRGGSLTVNCTGSGNGFYIGTGNGAGTVSLSNVAFTAVSCPTISNGKGTSMPASDPDGAFSVLRIDDSTVDFQNGIAVSNPDDSKARLEILNSSVTLSKGSLSTGGDTKSRQVSEILVSNSTFNAGNHAISLGSGLCSTSSCEIVGGSFTHTGSLTIGSGNGAQASLALVDNEATFKSGAFSFGTSAGADGTLRLVSSPYAFPASVTVGVTEGSRQTLALEDGAYSVATALSVGNVNATDSALALKNASLQVGGSFHVVPAVGGTGCENSSTGRIELVASTIDALGQLHVCYQGINGFASFVDDADSKLYVTNTKSQTGVMQVARYGRATMDLHGEANVNKLYIGNLSNAWGKVTVHPGASLNVTSELKAGFTGCGIAGMAGPTGIVEQLGGTVTLGSACAFYLGGNNADFSDASGIYRLAGGTLVAGNGMSVGTYGIGEFIIDGGVATVADGKKLSIANTGADAVGLVALNAGVLEVGEITKTKGGTGRFAFNGGTLRALNDSANFINAVASSMTVAVRAGGAVIDSNGHDVKIVPALVHDPDADASAKDGGLVKKGAGTLKLTGASTFTGDVIVEEGTLDMSTANFTLGSNAAIGGAGTLKAPAAGLTVDGTMDLDPATFAGGLTVEGTVTFGANAKVALANPEQLDENVKYVLVKATTLTGDVPDVIGLPDGWKVRLSNNALTVSKDKGVVIIFK